MDDEPVMNGASAVEVEIERALGIADGQLLRQDAQILDPRRLLRQDAQVCPMAQLGIPRYPPRPLK